MPISTVNAAVDRRYQSPVSVVLAHAFHRCVAAATVCSRHKWQNPTVRAAHAPWRPPPEQCCYSALRQSPASLHNIFTSAGSSGVSGVVTSVVPNFGSPAFWHASRLPALNGRCIASKRDGEYVPSNVSTGHRTRSVGTVNGVCPRPPAP